MVVGNGIKSKLPWCFLLAFMIICMSGCSEQEPISALLNISITIVDETTQFQIPPGITVEKAIQIAGISINPLDRVSPPSYTVLTEDTEIEVFRVTEKFKTEEIVIPFETQTMKNETLPEGQTLLVQAGVNGIQENTYRILSENGKEASQVLIKQELLVETRPEIIMVGVQTPYREISFSGRLVYLTAGNAWMMENTSGNRTPLLTSGDLDGRIFSLSPDGNWLLFTRLPQEPDTDLLNELWMLNVNEQNTTPIYLRVDNIIHFAEWHPFNPLTLAYSTVEPRETAPGWQANNDLTLLSLNENGIILRKQEIIETNSGGIYGWWGTSYVWTNDGEQIAYARPDSIGIINLETKENTPLLSISPLQTRGNWAWIPGIALSPLGDMLFFTSHGGSYPDTPVSESSQEFTLSALLLSNDYQTIDLVEETGMFTYPVPSQAQGTDFSVAFLQAIFPEQSETSGYSLFVMDQDSSNRMKIFPPDGAPGMDPQVVAWGPSGTETGRWIGLIYQGNLWLVDTMNGSPYQLTGDGSITRMDWQ